MRSAVLVLALAGCVESHQWTATASCTIETSRGRECFEYDLTEPAQRDSLRAQCMGSWDEDASCETDHRVSGCELTVGLLHGSYIYEGWTDIAGWDAQCRAKGGATNGT